MTQKEACHMRFILILIFLLHMLHTIYPTNHTQPIPVSFNCIDAAHIEIASLSNVSLDYVSYNCGNSWVLSNCSEYVNSTFCPNQKTQSRNYAGIGKTNAMGKIMLNSSGEGQYIVAVSQFHNTNYANQSDAVICYKPACAIIKKENIQTAEETIVKKPLLRKPVISDERLCPGTSYLIKLLDNESGSAIPDAVVRYNGINITTDSSGSLLLQNLTYDLRLNISKGGYQNSSYYLKVTQCSNIMVVNYTFDCQSEKLIIEIKDRDSMQPIEKAQVTVSRFDTGKLVERKITVKERSEVALAAGSYQIKIQAPPPYGIEKFTVDVEKCGIDAQNITNAKTEEKKIETKKQETEQIKKPDGFVTNLDDPSIQHAAILITVLVIAFIAYNYFYLQKPKNL